MQHARMPEGRYCLFHLVYRVQREKGPLKHRQQALSHKWDRFVVPLPLQGLRNILEDGRGRLYEPEIRENLGKVVSFEHKRTDILINSLSLWLPVHDQGSQHQRESPAPVPSEELRAAGSCEGRGASRSSLTVVVREPCSSVWSRTYLHTGNNNWT